MNKGLVSQPILSTLAYNDLVQQFYFYKQIIGKISRDISRDISIRTFISMMFVIKKEKIPWNVQQLPYMWLKSLPFIPHNELPLW